MKILLVFALIIFYGLGYLSSYYSQLQLKQELQQAKDWILTVEQDTTKGWAEAKKYKELRDTYKSSLKNQQLFNIQIRRQLRKTQDKLEQLGWQSHAEWDGYELQSVTFKEIEE